MTQISTLGGALVRRGRNNWSWSDGTPEPRINDMDGSWYYNFRCRPGFVEVLLSVAHRDKIDLGWVLAGVESGKFTQDHSGDHAGPVMISDDGVSRMRVEPGEDPLCGNEPIIHTRAIPRVALVPVDAWDSWSANQPLGARWDKADEPEIFAKARSLGWIG